VQTWYTEFATIIEEAGNHCMTQAGIPWRLARACYVIVPSRRCNPGPQQDQFVARDAGRRDRDRRIANARSLGQILRLAVRDVVAS
jgi:hypothetical protein